MIIFKSIRYIFTLTMVAFLLSGCIVSDRPLITEENIIQPFADYTLIEELDVSSPQTKRKGRFSFLRNGNGYTIKSVDSGSFSRYDGAFFVVRKIVNKEEASIYALQFLLNGGQKYMYLMLMVANKEIPGVPESKKGTGIISTFERLSDCKGVPDKTLLQTRAQSDKDGCSISSFNDLVTLFTDIQPNYRNDTFVNFLN